MEVLPYTLEEQIIIAIRQIAQAIDMHSRQMLAEYGLTAPQLGTLRQLARRQSASPAELAEALHLVPQTMVGIVSRLHERGLLIRKQDPRDRRALSLRLSEAGRKAIAKAPPLLRDQFLTQLATLPNWEQTQILATLQRVGYMMHAEGVEPVPFLYTETATPAATAPSDPAPRELAARCNTEPVVARKRAARVSRQSRSN